MREYTLRPQLLKGASSGGTDGQTDRQTDRATGVPLQRLGGRAAERQQREGAATERCWGLTIVKNKTDEQMN